MWRIGLLLAFIAVFVLLFMPGHGIMHFRKLQKQRDAMVKENTFLRQQNEKLTGEIESLKNDAAAIEQVAREKHGLLKKNEEVYDFNKK